MSATVLLIALAHAVPIILVGVLWRSKQALLITVGSMAFVAIVFGGALYALLDLTVVGVAGFNIYVRQRRHCE